MTVREFFDLVEPDTDITGTCGSAWPRVRDTRPFPDGPVGTYGWERYGFDCQYWDAEMRSALAESLSAFVAE